MSERARPDHRPPGNAGSGLTSQASRTRLIAEIRADGVTDERVLEAMLKVPRHAFVDETWRKDAYKNKALPIGLKQTISQPTIVGLMTQWLLQSAVAGSPPRKKVLEVGTGSGYQTAVLSALVQNVFSVERLKSLSERARVLLREQGCRNIHFGYSDGSGGWAAHAPYDGIIVTAAAAEVPKALIEQLDRGGRLVIPVGPPERQMLRVIDRIGGQTHSRDVMPVLFVPLLEGKA